MTAGLSKSQLDELAKYDTPTVCNVIELWNIRPRNQGYMDHRIKACFPKLPPMVGYALTSTFRSMSAPRSGDVYSGISGQLELFAQLPGPPVLVFQDLDEPTAAATFGEVMCSTYKAFGATGIVTSGTGRDLQQVEAMGFPAFTNGATCAHGYCHIISINVPITAGGIPVFPGDLLHGDLNGVSTIPTEIASEVAGACRELMAAEQIVLDYLKGPALSPKAYAAARDACASQIARLGKRLRGES